MRPASLLVLLAGTGPALAISRCVCRAKPIRRAVSALAAESATAFCSSLLAETVTVPLSATVETTLVLTVTSTVTAPQTLTLLSTTTSTTTVLAGTTTSYARAGGPLVKRTVRVPEALATLDPAVASKACLCYISPPSPSTVTTSHITTSTTTTTLPASTITTSPTLTTVTSTATSTSIEPTTVTVPGSLSFALVQTFTDNCVPYNYETLDFGLSMAGTSFEGAFQWCAAKCASYAGCTQIWVAWTGGSSFDCMTGTTGSKGWDGGEIQCDYPPIHKDAWWFSASSL